MCTAQDPVEAVLAAHERGRKIKLRTSGTSGRPRFVVRTTESWFTSFRYVAARTALDARSRVWVPGPLTATMNLFAAVHATVADATLVADPDEATHACLTPRALTRALETGVDLEGRVVTVAGDRLGEALHRRAAAAGARVAHYYGASELSFVAWGSHERDLRPFPGVAVAIRDGQIWVRSPYLCLGYDGPDGALRVDADGFATVGDRGRWEGGFLHVHGRGDDAVGTAGATVLVGDVEATLRPYVRGEVVVLGLSHPELGAVVSAVLTDASSFPAARAASRASLEPAHRPRLWFHLPALPLVESGKVDRRTLGDMLVSPEPPVRRLV